jgi:hypothetical protein
MVQLEKKNKNDKLKKAALYQWPNMVYTYHSTTLTVALYHIAKKYEIKDDFQ